MTTLRKDLEQEARQLTETIKAACRVLNSRTLPGANRARLRTELDLHTAARKAKLKRLWVSPRPGTTVQSRL